MTRPPARLSRALICGILCALAGCSGGAEPELAPDSGFSDAGYPDSGVADGGNPDSGVADAGSPDSGVADAGSPDSGVADGGVAADPPDPLGAGPCATATLTLSLTVPATGDSVPLHVVYPAGCAVPAPYPAVIVAHGLLLPVSQYAGTAQHLASFGYVAATADFPSGIFAPNHVHGAEDLSGALDALAAEGRDASSPLHGLVDAAHAGMLGHSLGGKLSLLAAASDARVHAVVGFDPVDGSMGCSPQNCPNAVGVLPLPIPLAYLGETLDSTGGNACAPAAENYDVLYRASASPTLEVTVNGASHMSFLDDPSTCGLECSFCKQPTAAHDQVIGLARAVSVAFFERWLRGDLGYDTDLGGARAKARWVDTGEAVFVSR